MRAAEAAGDLSEKRIDYVLEVLGLNHVQDFLELVEEHDLLEAACLGPVLEQALDDGLGQGRVLLNKLHDAVGELRMERLQCVRLVQWYEHALEEHLVLLLERYGEAVYNTS